MKREDRNLRMPVIRGPNDHDIYVIPIDDPPVILIPVGLSSSSLLDHRLPFVDSALVNVGDGKALDLSNPEKVSQV